MRKNVFKLAYIFLMLGVGYCIGQSLNKPPEGWSTKVNVVRVLDGDTIEVEIRRKITVRLLDCWSPETRTRDKEEKKRGLESKKYLVDFIEGKELVLYIPASKKDSISNIFTFGRVLGYVWADEKNISEEMVEKGYATKQKQ